MPRDVVVQVHPLDELHREVVDIADLVGIEGLDDVGMRQQGHRLEFALELAYGVVLGVD